MGVWGIRVSVSAWICSGISEGICGVVVGSIWACVVRGGLEANVDGCGEE